MSAKSIRDSLDPSGRCLHASVDATLWDPGRYFEAETTRSISVGSRKDFRVVNENALICREMANKIKCCEKKCGQEHPRFCNAVFLLVQKARAGGGGGYQATVCRLTPVRGCAVSYLMICRLPASCSHPPFGLDWGCVRI